MRRLWWLLIAVVVMAGGACGAAKPKVRTKPIPKPFVRECKDGLGCSTSTLVEIGEWKSGGIQFGYNQGDAGCWVKCYCEGGVLIYEGTLPDRRAIHAVTKEMRKKYALELTYEGSPSSDGTEKGFAVKPWLDSPHMAARIKGMQFQFKARPGHWYTEAQIVAALEMYDAAKGGAK